MDRQIPKNVRQIGNVCDSPKIYVEDYVDTFFAQMCEKTQDGPIGAFLVGELQKADEVEYVYIYGAIQMHELKVEDNVYRLDESTWKNAYEDCKQYFEDGEMLGWFITSPGAPLTTESNMVKLHKKSFPKKNTILVLKDPVEKEEAYFVHKFNDLLEADGHYTYYEKNPSMQNYMISCRKKNGVSPSETVEDRAAKDFRSLVRSREERQHLKRTSRLMYGASTLLVLIVMIMGVTMLNNFDKMKSVEANLNNLMGISNPEDVQETNGQILTVVEEQDAPGAKSGEESAVAAVSEEKNNLGSLSEDKKTPELVIDTEQSDEETDATAVLASGTDEEGNAGHDATASTPDTRNNDGIYVVEQGDTLAMISRKMYGDVTHVDAICKMNGLTDGNLIYIEQKLLLP